MAYFKVIILSFAVRGWYLIRPFTNRDVWARLCMASNIESVRWSVESTFDQAM